jgi:hypothetical protein
MIDRFTDEKSTMKWVFATMIRAAGRWCRVAISDIDRHQLELLRAEQGRRPATKATTTTTDRRNNRRRSVAA